MECHCKRDGIPVWCDIDKPLCGKAKLSARAEHFIMSTCIAGLIDLLIAIGVICLFGGAISAVVYWLTH